MPDSTSAHDDGLFLATGDIILKTEVAGEEYGVPRDPCTDHSNVPVGADVDDLVQAFRNLPIYQVTRPEHVELGGADGTYFEATDPPHLRRLAVRRRRRTARKPRHRRQRAAPLRRPLVDPRRRRTASRRPAELLGLHHRPARPRRHDAESITFTSTS